MLVESLFTQAAKQPDEIAVIDDRGRFTYRQLAGMAAGLAKLISESTNQPRVGLILPASAAFVASFYGTLAAGKGVVPINFLIGDGPIAHVIKDSGIDLVLTIEPLRSKVADPKVKVIDLLTFDFAAAATAPPKPAQKSKDDLAVLMYTSGTSGLPKGVVLTYENLQSDVDASIDYVELKHNHKFLGVIPLFHAFGMTAMMLAPIQLGATVIYLARFSPVAAMNAIREHKVSLMFGVPSMWAAILRLKNASPDDFKSFYATMSGGEPLPRQVYDAFLERFKVPLLEGFGLTETSPVVSMNTPQHQRLGSVGKPLPCVTVKITDETGKALGPDEVGEVWLAGPMIMQGYFNLPDATKEALTPDRFFKTGDLGKVDRDGFLYITGRKKEMIIVAGEKVFPREVEDVLMKHPAVDEAAVVGKKDASRGEVVVAFVIAKKDQTVTADELRGFCRDQGLMQWKVPREIALVDDLPRSPTGKVLKRVLAEQATKVN